MADHPDVAVFNAMYATFTTGDMDKLADLIAEDVRWHVPGKNLISGEYRGRDAIFGCFSKIFELSEGTYAPTPGTLGVCGVPGCYRSGVPCWSLSLVLWCGRRSAGMVSARVARRGLRAVPRSAAPAGGAGLSLLRGFRLQARVT